MKGDQQSRPVDPAMMPVLLEQYFQAEPREKPLLWRQYVECCQALYKQKASPKTGIMAMRSQRRAVHEEMVDVVREELERFPRNRRISRTELDAAIERITNRVVDRMDNALRRELLDVIEEGAKTAWSDLRITPEPLSPKFVETVERIVDSAVTQSALDGLGSSLKESFSKYVLDEYARGRLDPQRLALQMITEVGWQNRATIERISSTESWKTYTSGRMMAYADAEERRGEKFRYRFGTVLDDKTCTTCRRLIERNWQGTTMEEMRRSIVEESKTDKWDPEAGGGWPMPHIFCRHVIYRKVDI